MTGITSDLTKPRQNHKDMKTRTVKLCFFKVPTWTRSTCIWNQNYTTSDTCTLHHYFLLEFSIIKIVVSSVTFTLASFRLRSMSKMLIYMYTREEKRRKSFAGQPCFRCLRQIFKNSDEWNGRIYVLKHHIFSVELFKLLQLF